MAPEMFGADKSTKMVLGRQSDIWAAGVTLFNLLTKKYPFESQSLFDLANQIRGEPANLSELECFEPELIDLMERVLEKDPQKRIGIYQLLEHDWVTDYGSNPINLDLIESDTEEDSSISALREMKFKPFRDSKFFLQELRGAQQDESALL